MRQNYLVDRECRDIERAAQNHRSRIESLGLARFDPEQRYAGDFNQALRQEERLDRRRVEITNEPGRMNAYENVLP